MPSPQDRNMALWRDHLEARNAGDLDGTTATYTEDCIIQEIDGTAQTVKNYHGHSGVRQFFAKQMDNLRDVNGQVQPLQLQNVPGLDPKALNTLWAKWKSTSPAFQFKDVIDTYLFKKTQDGSAKIDNHFVHVGRTFISQEYYEVFSDKFETLRNDVWQFDIGKGLPNNNGDIDGWGNWEAEFYTNNEENAFIEDNVLHVRAIKDSDGNWTSARLTTRGTFGFAYGKIECRVRVRETGGPFSAVWALSELKYDPNVGWPLCGEIDVFEYQKLWGYTPATLHYQDHNGDDALSFHGNVELTDKNGDPIWHIYTAEWTPEFIAFFQDGIEIGRKVRPDLDPNDPEPVTMDNWPYTQDNKFYLIINNAMNPSWGAKAPSDLKYHDLEIDYIKVYQKNNIGVLEDFP